ncbi:hypothetical protein, partial [Sphingomonas sp.]|uniref:hypothetical protein n=1 Tax=Sphingomonas sp. TaxID=28214 RepID=UPI002FDA170A
MAEARMFGIRTTAGGEGGRVDADLQLLGLSDGVSVAALVTRCRPLPSCSLPTDGTAKLGVGHRGGEAPAILSLRGRQGTGSSCVRRDGRIVTELGGEDGVEVGEDDDAA